ncbi:MAG: bleomycin resistance protein [Pseudonocardiales bacterium]|nr:MAG: bleomycin resistance protein [Pseudonocardiales bacterium]
MTNTMNYFEIGSPEPEAAKAFYGTLFDWEVGEPSMPARYSMVDESRGGLWDTSQMGGANYAIFYVQVDDVHAAIDRAQELGAAVVVPCIDNGRIEFAHLTDPQGNRFGVWRPKDAS